MNVLGFDTCFNACSAAIGLGLGTKGTRIVGLCEPRETGHAETLVPMIRDVLASANATLDDIDRIAVTVGPGTFTGTRIGIAAARGLALARELPLVGVSSLAVMAEMGRQHDACRGPEDLIVAVDARRGQVYAQLFGRGGLEAKSPPLLLSGAEAAGLGGAAPAVVVGSGADAVAHEGRRAGRQMLSQLPELQPDARCLVAMAVHLPAADGPLRPLYMREADAKPQDGKALART